jgi:hypothetical protein
MGAMMLPSAAKADAIALTATVDGTLVASAASINGTLSIVNQQFGVFNLNSLDINSATFLAAPDILKTNTLDVGQSITGNHQLIIDIKAAGLVGVTGLEALLSEFSVTGMTSGWSAQEQTFVNGSPLASTPVFTTNSAAADITAIANITNPFVAEVRYTINSVGSGAFNGGIDISVAAVPGPVVGAGLPGLLSLIGFGGVWWKRRKSVA